MPKDSVWIRTVYMCGVGAGLIIGCIDKAGDDVTCCLCEGTRLIICVSYQ